MGANARESAVPDRAVPDRGLPEPAVPERELRRVARQLNLPGFGLAQQQRLHRAHVLIVGAGGLGCPALQQLAAAGIGEITLVDADLIDLSNIHRQILFGADDVGQPKVEVAARRAQQLQPGIILHPLQQRLTVDNACELVGGVDLVVDGSDSFATKYLVADAAEITGTPLVWGTVLRFAGEVALFHSGPATPPAAPASAAAPRSDTASGAAQPTATPPAASSPFERGVGLRDFFPDQPGADFAPDCATAGVLGVTTSVVAGLMSTRAIAYLAGLDRPGPDGAGLGGTARSSAVGRVTHYEALAATMRTYTVGPDPQRELATKLAASYEPTTCASPTTAAAATDDAELHPTALEKAKSLLADPDTIALDVREPHELILDPWRLPTGRTALSLPLSTLRDESGSLPPRLDRDVAARVFCAANVVVACASGVRSAKFIEHYRTQAEHAGTTLVNLPGGVSGTQPAPPAEDADPTAAARPTEAARLSKAADPAQTARRTPTKPNQQENA